MSHLCITRCRNNFQFDCEMWLSLIVTKSKCPLRCFDHKEWVEWGFDIHVEIMNLNFKEWKYCQDYGMKRVLITFLPKIVCGVSGRKIPTSLLDECKRITQVHPHFQYFLKLTNKGLELCNFEMHVRGCLSIIKHYKFYKFSSLIWSAVLVQVF